MLAMNHLQECFNRDALQAADALDLPSATASTLTDPIHPIFRASNFPGSLRLPAGSRIAGGPARVPSLYATISPALRLASRLISQPSGMLWWTRVLLGSVESVPGENREVLVDTPGRFGLARQKLTEHADYVSFRWRPDPDAFASTYPDPRDRSKTVIYLHSEMKAFAEGAYHDSTPSHQLRFQFFLALNLCHELAHSVMKCRRVGREPFFDRDEPQAELGASWEYSQFGGKIQPINHSMTAADGLMWYPWQSATAEAEAIERDDRRFVAVNMNWVMLQFQRDGWKKVRAPLKAAACTAVVLFTDDFDPQSPSP